MFGFRECISSLQIVTWEVLTAAQIGHPDSLAYQAYKSGKAASVLLHQAWTIYGSRRLQPCDTG